MKRSIHDLADPAFTTEPIPAAERKRREREAKAAVGLVRMELWAHPADRAEIQAFAEALQAERDKLEAVARVKFGPLPPPTQ